jgi:hypothetical protein
MLVLGRLHTLREIRDGVESVLSEGSAVIKEAGLASGQFETKTSFNSIGSVCGRTAWTGPS